MEAPAPTNKNPTKPGTLSARPALPGRPSSEWEGDRAPGRRPWRRRGRPAAPGWGWGQSPVPQEGRALTAVRLLRGEVRVIVLVVYRRLLGRHDGILQTGRAGRARGEVQEPSSRRRDCRARSQQAPGRPGSAVSVGDEPGVTDRLQAKAPARLRSVVPMGAGRRQPSASLSSWMFPLPPSPSSLCPDGNTQK